MKFVGILFRSCSGTRNGNSAEGPRGEVVQQEAEETTGSAVRNGGAATSVTLLGAGRPRLHLLLAALEPSNIPVCRGASHMLILP
ncbi:unnamed protein product [Urochloa humidicola]